MAYKIVRNSAGDVVAFGPDDNNYEPTIKDGEVLSVEDKLPVSYIKELAAATTAQAAAKTSAQTKLAALGLTADEIAAL